MSDEDRQRSVPAGSTVGPHVVLTPYWQAPNGAIYVHEDLVQVAEPHAADDYMPPIARTEKLGDVASWATYVKFWARPDQALLTWNVKGLHAILDFHYRASSGAAAAPNRCKWLADCDFTPSLEWDAWMKIATDQAIEQRTAIEFIETRFDDVVEPTATSLMALLRSLRANVQSTAKTTLNEDGSTDVEFRQEKSVKAAGELKLPSEFAITIPVLKGHVETVQEHVGLGAPKPVQKAVKYRLSVRVRAFIDNDAHLFLRFRIHNAEKVLETVQLEWVAAAGALLPDYTILRAAD